MNLELARKYLDEVKAYAADPEAKHGDEFDKAEALYIYLTENVNGTFAEHYLMLCELTAPNVLTVRAVPRRSELSEVGFGFLAELEAQP